MLGGYDDGARRAMIKSRGRIKGIKGERPQGRL
jgi:hypothetical protein